MEGFWFVRGRMGFAALLVAGCLESRGGLLFRVPVAAVAVFNIGVSAEISVLKLLRRTVPARLLTRW
jgi:hypothetical protein